MTFYRCWYPWTMLAIGIIMWLIPGAWPGTIMMLGAIAVDIFNHDHKLITCFFRGHVFDTLNERSTFGQALALAQSNCLRCGKPHRLIERLMVMAR